MANLKKKSFLLFTLLIFLLGLFVRVWRLSDFPVSLSIDEVAIGYNAYSIAETGRDEHGQFMPLAFKSVGDYKPPVNVYLTVPSVSLLGLNEFAVRLPTALMGALAVLFIIFLARELGLSKKASLFAGFVIALSPWHIHFSRASFEAVTALTFLILGVYLFLKWTKKEKWQLLAGSALSLSVSVWAYHAERFFVPLLSIFLIILFRKKFDFRNKKLKNQIIISIFVLATLALPFIYLTFFTPSIRERAASTSILRDISLTRTLHQGEYGSLAERVFDNDIFLVYRHWFGKYSNYFDLSFWFWKGLSFTPPGYPGMGLMYLINLPLFAFGVYAATKSKNKLLKKVLLFWFLAGPLPASFTVNEQHPLRALLWLPFFAFTISLGFEFLSEKFKKNWIWSIYALLLAANVTFFFDIYTNQFPRFFSEYWQYSYEEIANYVCERRDDYDAFIISETFGTEGPVNTGVPPLYLLFYCDWAREYYLENQAHAPELHFARPGIDDLTRENVLLIPSYWDYLDRMEEQGKIIKRIEFLNGKPAFLFVEP